MLAIAWGGEDAVDLAKELDRLTGLKDYEGLQCRGGAMDGDRLDAEGVKRVAKWPKGGGRAHDADGLAEVLFGCFWRLVLGVSPVGHVDADGLAEVLWDLLLFWCFWLRPSSLAVVVLLLIVLRPVSGVVLLLDVVLWPKDRPAPLSCEIDRPSYRIGHGEHGHSAPWKHSAFGIESLWHQYLNPSTHLRHRSHEPYDPSPTHRWQGYKTFVR
jgi:hypothetical protein